MKPIKCPAQPRHKWQFLGNVIFTKETPQRATISSRGKFKCQNCGAVKFADPR